MQGQNDEPSRGKMDYFEDLTGEIGEPETPEVEDLGVRLRQLREEKGYSLSDLAGATGYEEDFLSRVERGEARPQLGEMIRLSRALEGVLGALISGEGDKPYAITRRGDRKPVSRSTTSKGNQELYIYKSLASEVRGRSMEPLVVRLKENPEEETSIHEGEEFIFVLEGQVIIRLGQDRFDLNPGDSVYYQSSLPHVVAAKKESATILAVVYEGHKKE